MGILDGLRAEHPERRTEVATQIAEYAAQAPERREEMWGGLAT
ncbi:MAG: hypothetical protein ACE5JL_16620 [Dehalococcoidia bacterium]